MIDKRDLVLGEVAHERILQDRKWSIQNHNPLYWYSILGEEFGEVGKALCEGDLSRARAELVQVAAVAVAMIESMDRNELDAMSKQRGEAIESWGPEA